MNARRLLVLLATLAAARPAAAQCQRDVLPVEVDFGEARIALSGERLLVGLPDLEQAFVYDRDDAGTPDPTDDAWVQTALVPAPPASFFGSRVALEGDVALVSANGDVRVFERGVASWAEVAQIAHPGTLRSLALDGDVAALGTTDFGAAQQVQVHRRGAGAWPLEATLAASDGANGDSFGDAVDVSGDTVVVGAYGDDDLGAQSGSVYVYERAGTAWNEAAKLNGFDAASSDSFGRSVALADNRLLVGAPTKVVPGGRGAVYAFERGPSGWSATGTLVPPGAASLDEYGTDVAHDGDEAIVGSETIAYAFDFAGSWTHVATFGTSLIQPVGSCGRDVDRAGDLAALTAADPNGDGLGPPVLPPLPPSSISLASVAGTLCPPFVVAPDSISLAEGGAQGLLLQQNAAFSGLVYLVLGSASGTTPGFSAGSFTIPLNVDPFFELSLLGANVYPFDATLGTFDAAGRAAARFFVTTGLPPALIGVTLSHAYGVLDIAGTLAYVSPPQSLSLAP